MLGDKLTMEDSGWRFLKLRGFILVVSRVCKYGGDAPLNGKLVISKHRFASSNAHYVLVLSVRSTKQLNEENLSDSVAKDD